MLNYPDYPDRLFINMDSKQLLELTPFHRITVTIMIVLQYALFFISQALLVHYFALPIPFVSFPSIATTTSTETHYLWNTFLHLLFWAQHILMATLMYKKAWFSRWKYFALYDRYVYNIISGITLILIVANMQPSHIVVFQIPSWICIPFTLLGLFLLIGSHMVVGKKIMMPYNFSNIWNDKYLEIIPYQSRRQTNLRTHGVYGLVRHPMQSGILFLFWLGSNTYTTESLLFLGLMTICVIVGVVMEESRLCVQEKGYPDYMQKVKVRFIPYLI